MQLVDQDLLGAERFATVDQSHFAGDVSQVQRLFHGSVTTTDDCDFTVAIEETIAGRAGRDALAHESFFRRQAQITSAGTGRNDQGVTGVRRVVAFETERLASQVHGVDVVKHHFGFETLGVFFHPLHQHRAGQAVGITRPVINLSGGGQLTTCLHAGNQQRFEVGTCRVDRCAVTGRAGAENNHSGMTYIRHDTLLLTGHRYAWSERRCTGWNKKGPHKHLGKAYNTAVLKI